MTAPKVGDRVVAVPYGDRPHHSPAWTLRHTEPGIVVCLPVMSLSGRMTDFVVWSPAEHDIYSAPAEGLRVVETALYSPPAADDTPSFFIADDAHGDPNIWRHTPGADPTACLRRRDIDTDLWEHITRSIPNNPEAPPVPTPTPGGASDTTDGTSA